MVIFACAGCITLDTVLGHGEPHLRVEQSTPVNAQALTVRAATTSAAIPTRLISLL